MGAESLRLLHLCLRRAGPSSPSSFSALASPVPASPHSLVTVLGLPSPNPTPAWPVLHPTLPSHILARSRPPVLCRLQGVLCSSLDNSVSCFLHVGGHSSRLCRLYKHSRQLSVQTRGGGCKLRWNERTPNSALGQQEPVEEDSKAWSLCPRLTPGVRSSLTFLLQTCLDRS